MEDRSFYVKVGAARSTEARACSGVPQGSVLGPLLFLIYINDLVKGLKGPGYLFADDLKVVGKPSTADLQLDLFKISEWASKWELPLNAAKCKMLQSVSAVEPPARVLSSSNPEPIESASEIRDLGVVIHETFKPSRQCLVAAAKANRALMQLLRAVASREAAVLVPLYSVFVRPHLEYCVQAWAPGLVRDQEALERVQRRFTRAINGLRGLSYPDRLRTLNLFSLRRRRLRGDLIEVYKQLHGKSVVGDPILVRNRNSALRGHQFKLEKPRVVGNLRAQSFACRVVND